MAMMPFSFPRHGPVLLFVVFLLLSVFTLAKTIGVDEDIPIAKLSVPQIEKQLQVTTVASNQSIYFRNLPYSMC